MVEGKTTWTSVGGNNDERIGGNCHVYTHTNEKGEDSRVMVDIGGMFPEEKTGYDRFLANPSKYLNRIDEKGNLIKAEFPVDAVYLTHCHDDHIGALTHLSAMGFKIPEIRASAFTVEMAKALFFQQRVSKNLVPNFKIIKPGNVEKIGDINIEAIPVSHSAPGAFAYCVKTPTATIIHSGDYKADPTVKLGPATDFKRFEEIGKQGVDAFMFDATTVIDKGMTPAELGIKEEFHKITKECKGRRMIVPLIARSMERFASLYEVAASEGRKIVLYGGSLLTAYGALQKAGYDLEKITGKKTEVYDARNPLAQSLRPEEIMAICTGTQGEENAVLHLASVKQHRSLKFKAGQDIVVMAQSAIPVGNNPEKVEEMLGRIRDIGVDVIVSDHRRKDGQGRYTHASGHGAVEDIKMTIAALTKHAPKGHKMTCIPVHGGKHHFIAGAKVAQEAGCNALVTPNAVVTEISKAGVKVTNANASKETWIGFIELGDFRNPDFDYHIVDSKFKKISEIKYNKTKAFFRADDAQGRSKGKSKSEKNGKKFGFENKTIFSSNEGRR